jgi:hypothetical protein
MCADSDMTQNSWKKPTKSGQVFRVGPMEYHIGVHSIFALMNNCIYWFCLSVSVDRDLNALNIPTHDRKHQLQAKEMIGQAANHIRELTQGLSNFHTYTEQRSSIYPSDGISEPLSDINKIVSKAK